MADLPRILARPEGLSVAMKGAGLPRTNANAYGANVFGALAVISAEAAKQQSTVDVDEALSKYDLGVEEIKSQLPQEDNTERWQEQFKNQLKHLKAGITADMSTEAKQVFESATRKADTRHLIDVRAQAIKTGNSQRIAYAERASTELAQQAAETLDPAKRVELRGRYYEILGNLATGPTPALSPVQAEEMRQRFDHSLAAATVQAYSGTLTTELDNLVNRAYRQPSQIADIEREGLQMVQKAGAGIVPQNKVDTDKANFRDAVYASAIRGMIDGEPVSTLAALRAGKYDEQLKESTLRSLRREAEVEIDKRKRDAEAQRRAFEHRVGKQVDDFKAAATAGFSWAGSLGQLERDVQGTEHQAEFNQARKDASDLYLFNQMGPAEQENYLRNLSQGAKTGADAKLYAKLEAAHQVTKTQLKADPMSLAIRRRIIPPLGPFDVSNPTSMQERNVAADLVEQRYKLPTISPLSDDEANQLSGQLGQVPADTKVQIYRQLQRGFGDDRTKAIAAQLAGKKDTMLALTMGLSLEAPRAASDILRGQEILRDNPKLALAGREMSAARNYVNESLSTAYAHNPEQHGAVSDAALAVYAAKSWAAKDLTGVFNSSRMEESISEVTGGLISIRTGLFSSQKIQPPSYGMDEGSFRDLLAKADYSKAKGFTKADILKTATFESIGDGKYLVRVGPGYVQSANGPFILDLGAVVKAMAATAGIGGAAGLIPVREY